MAFLNRALDIYQEKEIQNYPERICFDHYPQGKTQRSLERESGLPVSLMERNNNAQQTPSTSTIYVLSEFENNPEFDILQKISNTWILGPIAFKEMLNDQSLKLRLQPLYCTAMYDLCFYINCPWDIPLMERMVKLIKWMGGRFVLRPNSAVTHMISTSTLAKGYVYCYTFNVPVMTTQWVERCWQKRHVYDFKAISDISDGDFLGAFADIYICFKGFQEESADMERLTVEHGGVVVGLDDPTCTHLVLHPNIANCISITDIPFHVAFTVTHKWFWMSIEQKHRHYEENYRVCFTRKSIRDSLVIGSDWQDPKGDGAEGSTSECKSNTTRVSTNKTRQKITRPSIMHSQDRQRKLTFEELCLTEMNYLQCLEELVNLKKQIAAEGILSQLEMKYIFGNIEQIVSIHTDISAQLEKILNDWHNDAKIGQIFINVRDELMKEYVVFSNNFKTSSNYILGCEQARPKFKEILESWKNRLHGELPKEVFIRPIQRLCSVFLLLHEIHKQTREDCPDKELLHEAMQVCKSVLARMNTDIAKSEKLSAIFDIYNQIDGCPADLVTSHREFITQFPVFEILNKGRENHMEFFLFNDVIEIAAVRSSKPLNVFNIAANDSARIAKKKPYKHIVMLPLSMITCVLRVEQCDEDTANIFGFNVRSLEEGKGPNAHCFQYLSEDGKLDKIIQTIDKLLSGRDSSEPLQSVISYISLSSLGLKQLGTLKKQENVSQPSSKVMTSSMMNLAQSLRRNQRKRSFSCSDVCSSSSTKR